MITHRTRLVYLQPLFIATLRFSDDLEMLGNRVSFLAYSWCFHAITPLCCACTACLLLSLSAQTVLLVISSPHF